MHQAFDAAGNPDKSTETGNSHNLPQHYSSWEEVVLYLFPGIAGYLLYPQGNPFVFLIDVENTNLYIFTRFEHLGWISHRFFPRHVGYVNESFYSRLQFDKSTETGNILNNSRIDGTFGVPLINRVPRVG